MNGQGRGFWQKHWGTIVVIIAWLGVVVTNYRPGTRLTGWDNLHPELDITYDIWRSFNAVWQEYQGLGLLGGMAHAADLPRQLIILLCGWAFSVDHIRYLLLFSCLLIGALGAKRLFERLFVDRRDLLPAQIAATSAALFYLLNLATVQNFYVAFEPYYVFYGFLPWLLDSIYQYWRWRGWRRLARLAALSFLAAPLAYIQTNFVVYGLVLTGFGLGFLGSRAYRLTFAEKLRRVSIAAAIVVGTNLFWLAPMAYFTLTGGSTTTMRSQVNQTSTREVALQNQQFANWRDIATLRGYWFSQQDYRSTDDRQMPVMMMGGWDEEPATRFFAWVFAGLLLIGLAYLLIYRRGWRSFATIWTLAISIFLLFAWRFDWPFLQQIFRSPFTKVAVPLSLSYSLIFGAAFLWLDRISYSGVQWLTLSGFLTSLWLYSLPTWSGEFVYPALRPEVPAAYEALFEFFATQPAASRVALLPAESQYGWQHQTWGYRGIGFYWFGLRQSILNRAFDVWSFDDEEAYYELHTARLAGDGERLASVLRKYDIRYLLYDDSIRQRGRDPQTYHRQWLKLIDEAGCQSVFSQGDLEAFDCGSNAEQYVSAPEQIFVSRTSLWHQFADPRDRLPASYIDTGRQITDYPFAWLDSRELAPEVVSYRSRKNQTLISLQGDVGDGQYHTLQIPALTADERVSVWFGVRQRAGMFEITLRPLATLAINDQPLVPFQDIEFSIPALEDTDEIYFDFGSDYTRLNVTANDASAIISLSGFETDQVWKYFAADQASLVGSNVQVAQGDTIEVVVPADIWASWRQRRQYTINMPVTSLRAEIESRPFALSSLATDDQDNCDVVKRGVSQRRQPDTDVYTYFATNGGSFCDTFYSSSLDNAKHSFLLHIEAENITGLPLLYYFWDINNQVPSWETTLADDQTSHSFSFPRVITKRPTAYFDVHNANRSKAGETVENRVSATDAYPVPSEWLMNITLLTDETETQICPNALQVGTVTKRGTSHYQVTASLAGQQGVIVLNQAYHPGWQAKSGGQTLTHVRVDDWANGWLVTDESCPSGQCQIKIVFRPQWLEWLGLAVSLPLAFVGLGYLGYRRWHDRRIYDPYRTFAGKAPD